MRICTSRWECNIQRLAPLEQILMRIKIFIFLCDESGCIKESAPARRVGVVWALSINGLGKVKYRKYGKAILEIT